MTLRDRISPLLREGYGAEDIGVRLDCAAELIRREIERMKREGVLAVHLSVKREAPELSGPPGATNTTTGLTDTILNARTDGLPKR